MNGRGKSDGPVIPENLPNKAAAAEAGERKGAAKGNTEGNRTRTQAGPGVSSAWTVCVRWRDGIGTHGSARCCTMSAWNGW